MFCPFVTASTEPVVLGCGTDTPAVTFAMCELGAYDGAVHAAKQAYARTNAARRAENMR